MADNHNPPGPTCYGRPAAMVAAERMTAQEVEGFLTAQKYCREALQRGLGQGFAPATMTSTVEKIGDHWCWVFTAEDE